MTDYTVTNLKEIENSAERFGLAPDVEARFARGALGTTSSGLSYQRYAAGIRAPFAHKHAKQEEVYVILSGSAQLKVDDDIVELKEWDAIRIPPGVTRQWQSGPDGFELLAIGAPVSKETDAEMIADWWTD
jgi:mannose-6-phosphate isomerase-like protein (cupin superfamily)